jgi:hypothetical protein
MSPSEVLDKCPLAGNAAKTGLPSVHVGVNEARDDNASGGVYDVGCEGEVGQIRADVFNVSVFDQDVPDRKNA